MSTNSSPANEQPRFQPESPRVTLAREIMAHEISELVSNLLAEVEKRAFRYLAVTPDPDRVMLDLIIEQLQEANG